MIRKCILEKDPQLQIEPEDFSEEADSTILVRERVKGTKLEGNFKKFKGQTVSQSENTIPLLPKSGKQDIYSKRDVAEMRQDASSSKRKVCKKKPKTQEKPPKPIQQFWRESISSAEMRQPPKVPETEQQIEQETMLYKTEKEGCQNQMKKSKKEIDKETVKEEKEEIAAEGERKEGEQMPIKEGVKWEKEKKSKPTRRSTRNHKKTKLAGSQCDGDYGKNHRARIKRRRKLAKRV